MRITCERTRWWLPWAVVLAALTAWGGQPGAAVAADSRRTCLAPGGASLGGTGVGAARRSVRAGPPRGRPGRGPGHRGAGRRGGPGLVRGHGHAAAECSRSSSPGRGTRPCGPRTSRCARSSRRATRSRRGSRWPCWRRGRPTARQAASTGACAAGTPTWTRCRCCPRRCCATARRGCCRCSGCRCRSPSPLTCRDPPGPPCWWCSACRGGGVSPGRRRPGRRRGSSRRRCRR